MTIPLFNRLCIEINADCNRRCWFCSRTLDNPRIRGEDGFEVRTQMPTESVLSILQQSHDLGFRGKTAFHFQNEPTLDPRLIFFAQEANRLEMETVLNTNGDVLKVYPQLRKEVVKVFKSVRIGIYDATNPQQVKQQKQYWRHVFPDMGDKLGFSVAARCRVPRRRGIKEHRSFQGRSGDTLFPDSPCHMPLDTLGIGYEGDVYMCPDDSFMEFAVGSVIESSVKDVWYGERRVQMARNLILGKRILYPACSECPRIPEGACGELTTSQHEYIAAVKVEAKFSES